MLSRARAWLDLYPAIAVATVMRTWGSAPVPVGGQLLIAGGPRVEGCVSGGCVEAAVIAEAEGVLEHGRPKVLGFGVEDEMAWRVGLPCGGRIEVMLSRFAGDQDRAVLDRLIEARRTRRHMVLETNLSTGARTLHETLGAFSGAERDALTKGVCISDEAQGSGRFLHAYAPETQLVIVGAGHLGQILAELAGRVGYKVTVIDPRGVYATPERFEGAAFDGVTVVQSWPEAALSDIALDPRTALITLSHVAEIDDEALAIALRSPAFYVGALGSRRSHAQRVTRLSMRGLQDAEIARLDAPAGLPIGAVGPHEIAVSMLAAIIKAQRSGS